MVAVKRKRFDNIEFLMNFFLVLGMLISLFLLYEHFAPSTSEFCKFGESLDCGVVNKSPYANIDGISYLLTIDYGLPLPLIDLSGINLFFDLITSNAFLGFITLLFVFLLNNKYKNKKFLWIQKGESVKWIRGVLIFGLAYGAYLFYIQHSILKTYCIFCLALDVTIISLVIISRFMKK